MINDELQHEVNREESMWSLESGKHITVRFDVIYCGGTNCKLVKTYL